MLSLYWRAIRGRILSVSLVSILLGASIVRRQWDVALWPILLPVAVGGLLVHAGANLWNDYEDELNGADRANLSPSPFNGGSRVIQRGEASVRAIKLAALSCFGLSLVIAIWLVPRGGWGVPVLAVAGIIMGLGYSSKPTWLCGHGLGEAAVAIAFGPLLVEGTVLALAGKFSWAAVWASLPLGLLVAAVLLLNEVPDRPSDQAVGKRTLGVRWGVCGALFAYRSLVIGAFIMLTAAVLTGMLPIGTAVALGTAPLAVWVCRRGSRYNGDAGQAFTPLAAGTVTLHFSLGVLLALGFWL